MIIENDIRDVLVHFIGCYFFNNWIKNVIWHWEHYVFKCCMNVVQAFCSSITASRTSSLHHTWMLILRGKTCSPGLNYINSFMPVYARSSWLCVCADLLKEMKSSNVGGEAHWTIRWMFWGSVISECRGTWWRRSMFVTWLWVGPVSNVRDGVRALKG